MNTHPTAAQETVTTYFVDSDPQSVGYPTLQRAAAQARPGDLVIEVRPDGSMMGERRYFYVNRDREILALSVLS